MIHIWPEINLLFIKVPGTGTSSFFHQLNTKYKFKPVDDPPVYDDIWKMNDIKAGSHFTAIQIRKILSPDIWETYEKVAFIRNPYDWLNSIYNKPQGEKHYGIKTEGKKGKMSFGEFIRYVPKTPYFWITDSDGEVMIDTIYRTEDLDQIVFPKYGVLPTHLNTGFASPKKKRKFTQEDIGVIKKKFHRELEHYDVSLP